MSPTADPWKRLAPWRRHVEVGFWVAILAVQLVFNALVTWLDLRRADPGYPWWPPFVWEATSSLVVGLLIPVVAAFDRRFPLRWDRWRRHLPLHVAASVAFCVAHIVGMVVLRKAVYATVGLTYATPEAWRTFAYEYLKDARSYALILVAFYSWRLFLLRLQGEARVLDAPEPPQDAPPPAAAPSRPERFLVRKLRKEFLIAASDIEWLQAQGNYVALHVNGHDYLVRSTLSAFVEQLDPARFVRVHRSYVAHLDRIAEIAPTDDGDARLTMRDGSVIPCSRRYRDALAGPSASSSSSTQ